MKRSIFKLNPIIVKEVRSRMRGWRAFAILTAYLIFLGLFGYGIYRVLLYSSPYTSGMPLSPFIGQTLHTALANLSLFFVAFLTPALTATAISSEYEKLTIEMLQATPLAPQTVLFGKLVAAAGYIFLLLLAAVPMVSLIFIFGGVSVTDLLLSALIILCTALAYGVLGLFFSAWRKRTIQALVLSYVVVLLLIGGTYALYAFWGAMARDFPPRIILLFNPFSALASVLAEGGYRAGPLPGLSMFLAGGGPAIDNPAQFAGLRPLWHYTLAFYLGLSLILYWLATRFIKPIRPWRFSKQSLALTILAALLYLGGGGAIFAEDIDRALNPPPDAPTPTPVMPPPPVLLEGVPPTPPPPLPTLTPAEMETAEPEAVETKEAETGDE